MERTKRFAKRDSTLLDQLRLNLLNYCSYHHCIRDPCSASVVRAPSIAIRMSSRENVFRFC